MPHTNSDRDPNAALLLKPRQVQAILNIGNTLFYELVNDGRLPLIKIGQASFVDRRSVERFVDGLHVATQKAHA
jgi:predicted DNA-binding transcriptional regulator AlpA